MMYVLIVITMLSGGPVVTMQDFNDEASCEAAKTTLAQMLPAQTRLGGKLACVPKGG